MYKYVIAGIALLNLRSYYMMWRDKNLARKGEFRTPEATLLLSALFMGAFGVVAASFPPIRHKGRKPGFMIPAYLCLVVNLVVIGWWVIREMN